LFGGRIKEEALALVVVVDVDLAAALVTTRTDKINARTSSLTCHIEAPILCVLLGVFIVDKKYTTESNVVMPVFPTTGTLVVYALCFPFYYSQPHANL